MNRIKKAVTLFNQGFSCSQAVFAAFAPELGVDETIALKIAQPFGGGIAGRQEICGAVAGALMVIGLKYGKSEVGDSIAKEKTYYLTEKFLREFQRKNDSTVCRELLDIDENLTELEQQNLKSEICNNAVGSAAKILNKIL
jgi:C_GCAxxG_C_C family probable redox protein